MNRIDNSGKGIAGLGRGGDTRLAHVMTGEMVVPPVISPQTQEIIKKEMIAAGINPEEYTVGEGMSINPITGLPEFGLGKFLKKSVKSLKKVVKKVAPIAGALLIPGGGALGGLGSKIGLTAAKFPKLANFAQTVAGAGIPGISQIAGGMTAGPGNYGSAITTGLTKPFGGFFSSATGSTLGPVGSGIQSSLSKAFPGLIPSATGSTSQGGGMNLPLLLLAGAYGKAVKSDYEKKQGGLQDIRTSIRPDLVPQQTYGGFDLGIRKAAMGGLQELDMRMGGPSVGPGTGTSDDIPAMLSDGEFVMTSAANNGLGGFKITKTETGLEIIPSGKPNRQKGAKNMDKLMKVFENYNDIGKA